MSVETPSLPHLPQVQALRGLAALGVLLAHMFVVETKYSAGSSLLGEWALLGQAGVDLFFVISGFIMVYVTWETPRGSAAPLPFVWRRLTRIYPLYWVVSAAVLAVWLLRPGMVFSSNPDPDILKSFLLIPDDSLPLLSVGWTLIHEMYFYLVFAFILLAPRKALVPLLLVWVAILSAAVGFREAAFGPVYRVVFNPLTLEFIAGAMLAVWWVRSGAQWGRSVWFLLLASAIVLTALSIVLMGEVSILDLLEDHWQRFGTIGVAAIAVFAARLLADIAPSRLGVWLGDISYSLYLTHILTLSVVGRIWSVIASEGQTDNVVALVVMFAASLAVAHTTYALIERPLIRWFRRRQRPASTVAHASD